MGLYGNYGVVGNTLKFEPTNFTASTQSAEFSSFVLATSPEVTITAKGTNTLSRISVHQEASYQLSGTADVYISGSIDSSVDTSHIAFRDVKEVFSSVEEDISSIWTITQTADRFKRSSATVVLNYPKNRS